jgi:hypothetical protein
MVILLILQYQKCISCFWKCCLPILTSEMWTNCYVKPLQERSMQFYTLYAWCICCASFKHEPELKLCGMQMLMTNPEMLISMIWWDNVNLALSHSMMKILDEFLLQIKQYKLIDCLITYQSHMTISKYKPSTYSWLWPLSFTKLLWPFVETFHASMIEITYTHIYMLTPTPGVTQNMPSIHQK